MRPVTHLESRKRLQGFVLDALEPFVVPFLTELDLALGLLQAKSASRDWLLASRLQ